MRSLTLKLTVAFLFVGLIGATLVALLVAQRIESALGQFMVDRGRAALVNELEQHYSAQRGWNDVGRIVQRQTPGEGGGYDRPFPVVLCAEDGRVVWGNGRYSKGSYVPESERTRGEPIKVDGKVVGWLLADGAPKRPGYGSPEADFLARIRRAVAYSAAGATATALLLGIFLARTLTHPLRELTTATQAVAKGELGRQVEVRSRDELGALATSFNRMSADLEHASALRRQMTADIAHDLRTPLSVILGYTEALREGKLPATEEVYETMHTEAQHLQHLIDDLRTLSLADAGALQLNRQMVAPQAILERAASMYKAQANEQKIALVVQADPEMPDVDVDPERMAQVLGNLLSNALRYTPEDGAITLEARADARAVQLRIRDTGSGIAREALPHIFERFYRADTSRHGEDGSSGLGLAIAKSIVEAHGGTISVASEVGKGTTFTIRLTHR